MSNQDLALLGDFGGTKIDFAILNLETKQLGQIRRYNTADFAGPVQVIDAFCAQEGMDKISASAIAMPGVVKDGKVEFSIVKGWVVPIRDLEKKFPSGFRFINDVEALGWAITAPDLLRTRQLLRGKPFGANAGVRSVFSVGTGANEATAIKTTSGWVVVGGEGGQKNILYDLDILPDVYQLDQFLRSHDPRGRLELITSGSALPILYAYHAKRNSRPQKKDIKPDEVLIAATREGDLVAQSVVRLMMRTVGMATADIHTCGKKEHTYITGGTIDHLIEFCGDDEKMMESLVTAPLFAPIRRQSRYAGVNAVFDGVNLSHVTDKHATMIGLQQYALNQFP